MKVIQQILLLFILLLVSQNFTFANSKTSFAPENDLYIGPNDTKSSNVSRRAFKRILNKIEGIYSPIVKEKGGKLVVKKKWWSGKVNAYASRIGKKWNVALFGGLARHDDMTEDGLALVACHEFGHHLGTHPKKSSHIWASAEGQADYYGTLKCLRKYFKDEDNVTKILGMQIDPIVRDKCNDVFANTIDSAICQRSAQAGLALAKVLKDVTEYNKPVSFSTPDDLIVNKTNTAGYPSVQCRLDTLFAGALCFENEAIELSETNLYQGLCSGSTIGSRPLCWFNPNYEI